MITFAVYKLNDHILMSTILLIDSATEVCSAALSVKGNPVALRESMDGLNHAEKLTVFIEELLYENGISPNRLQAVCVGKGPGSYTGLRIGVSVAKGICYALGIPLLAVSSLDAMAFWVAQNPNEFQVDITEGSLLCPMIDARRMEVYTALYDSKGNPTSPIEAKIVDQNSFGRELENGPVYFFGNGTDKCQSVIQHANARFINGVRSSARFMSILAYVGYKQNKFEDVAYFEPYYLKEFVATVPKNKIL